MSKTACHPVCLSSSPWCWVQTSGSEPGGAPGPAVTAVWDGGPCGPSAWAPTMPQSLLGTWQPRRAQKNTWREDALVGAVGIYHLLPPYSRPALQQAPSSRLPVPMPSTQWVRNAPHGGAGWGMGQGGGGCWRGPGSPRLTVPCPCPPIAVPQVSSSPRRRRWPIGCGSLVRWPK